MLEIHTDVLCVKIYKIHRLGPILNGMFMYADSGAFDTRTEGGKKILSRSRYHRR